MRYHLYVNNDGVVLCVQTHHRDGTCGEPWTPATYQSVLEWAELLLGANVPMSIHTSTL